MRRAISERVAPFIAFGVSDSGERRQLFYEGQTEQKAPPDFGELYFDLASLTKVISTTSWCYELCAAGALSLAEPLGEKLPELSGALARAPLSDLLSHRSGLPAHRPFYEGFAGPRRAGGEPRGFKARIRQMICRSPLEHLPGEVECYSDLGFLLLEWLCERAARRSLEERWATLPLHCAEGAGFHFRPLAPDSPAERAQEATHSRVSARGPAPLAPRWRGARCYVPTERCPWRERLLCAEVHDDNCWLMGGVAGHAGLFGTLPQVLAFGEEIIRAYHHRGGPFAAQAAVLREAFQPARSSRGGSFLLGWDSPSSPPAYSSAGRGFSARSVGHLGFTGTSLWLDLEREVAMVLLSNRVCPSRDGGAGIRWLRPQLHDAAWAFLQR